MYMNVFRRPGITSNLPACPLRLWDPALSPHPKGSSLLLWLPRRARRRLRHRSTVRGFERGGSDRNRRVIGSDNRTRVSIGECDIGGTVACVSLV